jgi:hypothetical protein
MGILTGFGADSGIASALVDSTVKLMEGFCKK